MYDDCTASVTRPVAKHGNERKGTLRTFGASKIDALCGALGLQDRAPEIKSVFDELLGPYGETELGRAPTWSSDVCDDHSPFEFSISSSPESSDFRILVETISADETLVGLQDAGRDATRRLAYRLGLDTQRLDAVESLFMTDDPAGLFSRWHGVDFRPGRPPEVKVYLNPRIHEPVNAASVVEQALDRVGLPQAWPALARVRLRGDKDELKYFSLDLGRHDDPRVKVYVRHHEVTCEELESALHECHGYEAGDATTLCRAMVGHDGPYTARPIFSCITWVDEVHPPRTTTYVPIAGYVEHDAEAFSRIRDFMASAGIPTDGYERALRAFCSRPLEAGVGMQSYVSFKRDRNNPKMTVYLGPEAYHTRPALVRDDRP